MGRKQPHKPMTSSSSSASSAANVDATSNKIQLGDEIVSEMLSFMQDQHKDQKQSSLPPQVSRHGALNFLIESKNDLKAAKTSYKQHVKWRHDFMVDELTIRHVCVPQMYDGVVSLSNAKDKKGRPIVLFQSGLHNPKGDFLSLLRCVIYVVECTLAKMDPNGSIEENQICIINDYTGFSMKNSDKNGLRLLLDIIRVNYPRRAGAFIAVNAPTLLSVLWKVIRGWLNEEIKSLVHITSGVDYLQQVIANDQLFQRFGGAFAFDPADFVKERAAVESVELPANNAVIDLQTEYNRTHDGDAAHKHHDAPFCVRIDGHSAAATTSSGSFAGSVKKRGFHNTKFKSFYATLFDKVLFYYGDKKDKCFAGFICLDSECSVNDVAGESKRFDIITPTRTYFFESSDKKKWLEAISAELKR